MRMLLTRRLLAPSRLCRSLTTVASLHGRLQDRQRLGLSSSSSEHYSGPSLHRGRGIVVGVSIRRSLSGGSDPKNNSSSRNNNNNAAKSDSAAITKDPATTRDSHEADKHNRNDVPRRIVVRRRSGDEDTVPVDLANLKDRVGSLIPKKSRGYQRAVLRNRARAAAAAAASVASEKATTTAITSAVNKRSTSAPPTPMEIMPVSPPLSSKVPPSSASSSPLVPGTVMLLEGADKPRSGGDRGDVNSKPDAATAAADERADQAVIAGPLRSKLPRSRIRLPVVNASALLDKQAYCLQSATASTSRSGTDAALRLHKGQQELIGVLRREILSQQQQQFHRAGSREGASSVENSAASKPASSGDPLPPLPNTGGGAATSSSAARPPPYYVLQGHGVPHQLLQAHIDFADALLRRCAATDVSFSNASLKVDFVRKRKSADNSNEVLPWSAVASGKSGASQPARDGGTGVEQESKKWDDGREETMTQDMQLYLTVMNRIANALGLILPPSSKRRGNSLDGTSTAPPLVDEYDNEWTEMKPAAFASSSSSDGSGLTQSAANGAVLKHWHAEFLRGRSVPPEWVPTSELASKHPQPLVEWTPLPGMAAPGRVTIRLQGYPTSSPYGVAGTSTSSETTIGEDGTTTTITRSKPLRRRRSQPTSLVFDACFRQV